jgi:hypothetical protein
MLLEKSMSDKSIFEDALKLSLLPKKLLPKEPDYLVWYTGTLGQAEWLITHSESLVGKSLPINWPKTENSLEQGDQYPDPVKALMSLEQPDIVVSDTSGKPLISIEITEQQDFGSNSQQRIARFWSAVANRVPSAYLLPIEGYQLEKIEKKSGRAKAYDETDSQKRAILLSAAQFHKLNGESVWKRGVRSPTEIIERMREFSKNPATLKKRLEHIENHMSPNPFVRHLQEIHYLESVHKIEDQYHRAYIRKTGIPGSMLLSWFEKCNKYVPTNAFRIPIEYKSLFRTNGILHTMEDERNPHLSFRNLPPGPGIAEIDHKEALKDEISLFFDMVNAVVNSERVPNLHRELLTKPNYYFPSSIKNSWRKEIRHVSQFEDTTSSSPEDEDYDKNESKQAKSGDFVSSSELLKMFCRKNVRDSTLVLDALSLYPEFHLYKIRSSVTRALADPYSGGLATRDILFTRDESSMMNLLEMKRSAGLIFWVDFHKEGLKNGFLDKVLLAQYKENFQDKKPTSIQDGIIELIENIEAIKINKSLRSHILFSDLIIVRRHQADSIKTSAYLGAASLIKLGKISRNAKFLNSLHL